MHSCLSLTRKSLTYRYTHSLVKSVKWFIAYMEKSICDNISCDSFKSELTSVNIIIFSVIYHYKTLGLCASNTRKS